MDSLLAQTLKDMEIILVDDASTDNTLEIMRNYETECPEKVRVIHSEINLRLGGARNLGIEAAQGEYIGFTDCDDWVDPEMFESMYDEAVATDSDMCYCRCRKVAESGKSWLYNLSYPIPTGNISEQCRKDLIANHVTLLPCRIYRRSLFTENHIRFPQHLRYEDVPTDALLILYIKRISAVEKPYYNYFVRSGSITTETNDTKYKDKIEVCRLIVDEYKQRGCYEQYRDAVNYLFFRKGYIHAAVNYILNTTSPHIETVNEIRNCLLSIDSDYRRNPYYPGKFAFRIIDYVISARSVLLLKLLRGLFVAAHYNI
jgi:glycosyltransferase involved in cell wall biosynthesis